MKILGEIGVAVAVVIAAGAAQAMTREEASAACKAEMKTAMTSGGVSDPRAWAEACIKEKMKKNN